jgi:hypothetical protein
MHQLCKTLSILIVTFGLILSDGLVGLQVSPESSVARAADPNDRSHESSSRSRAGERASGRQERKRDHRRNQHQEHKPNRTKADRTQDRTGTESKQVLKKAKAEIVQELCSAPGIIRLKAVDGCTHGPDPAPKGLDVKDDVSPLRSREVTAQATKVACDGDGKRGFRVQVLYVRASDVQSRYADYVTSIQAWAADADQIFRESAAETGGKRSLRFVHDSNCQPTVHEVVVSPEGDGDFWRTVDELQSQGLNRTDRIYLSFVDANTYCGVGMLWDDDRKDIKVNQHNIGPSFSRVDSGCWGGKVAAHELMHNLGGVQLSAPNASSGFHCIDEFDVMCYADSGSVASKLRVACDDLARDSYRFDCGHDDYFNTNPAPGSYLDTHWNAANNRFLIGAKPPRSPSAKSPHKGKKK